MRPIPRQLDIAHLMASADELIAGIRGASTVGVRSRAGGVGCCAAAVHGAAGAVGRFRDWHLAEGWVVAFEDGGEKGMLRGQRRQGFVGDGGDGGLLDGHGGWGVLVGCGGRDGLGSASRLGRFIGHGACGVLGGTA
jgi:hypothetical protein